MNAFFFCASAFTLTAGGSAFTVDQHAVVEIPLQAQHDHDDPYNTVELSATITAPDGATRTIPAFWDGNRHWKFRFSSSIAGTHNFLTTSNREDDAGLHGVRGAIEVTPATGVGRLRVAENKRHFIREDRTPFFWLGDTWWMGLSARLPLDDFKALAADRVEKGFNVIQIVMGPYPDMDAFDPRSANDAGHPFTQDFAAINPAYYQEAEKKIDALLDANLTPCMVGMWGYYLPRLGVEKINRYWRYLIARYGAYPVVWCAAGEGAMPYYLTKDKDAEKEQQRQGWTEVMRFIQSTDPYDNPLTIHPTRYGREQVTDPTVMDFEMLQTGHGDIDSVPTVIESVRTSVANDPVMPVVNSEVNYEGILGRAWQNIQRLDFYHSIMNGAAGFTYGANGIWQVNTDDKPYGPSPHGRAWGNTPWRQAAQLPGSRQVGLGAAFFRDLPWWEMTRHPEWVAAPEDTKAYTAVAAGIPNKLRVIYVPMCWDAPKLTALEDGVEYAAVYVDPVSGMRHDIGVATPNEAGEWQPPLPPEVHDWILLLQARDTTTQHAAN